MILKCKYCGNEYTLAPKNGECTGCGSRRFHVLQEHIAMPKGQRVQPIYDSRYGSTADPWAPRGSTQALREGGSVIYSERLRDW